MLEFGALRERRVLFFVHVGEFAAGDEELCAGCNALRGLRAGEVLAERGETGRVAGYESWGGTEGFELWAGARAY